jgi:hypothetical protein
MSIWDSNPKALYSYAKGVFKLVLAAFEAKVLVKLLGFFVFVA